MKNDNQQPPHIAIPGPLAQALVNYLGRQPYFEVAEFIAAFQQAPAVNLPPPEAPTPVAAEKTEAQKQLEEHVRQAVINKAVTDQQATQPEQVSSEVNGEKNGTDPNLNIS